jgi:hypothetical protein
MNYGFIFSGRKKKQAIEARRKKQGDSVIGVVKYKKNPNDRYYFKKQQLGDRVRTIYLTPETKAIIKQNPEIFGFLKDRIIYNKHKKKFFKTKNASFLITELFQHLNKGRKYYRLTYKSKNTLKSYFVKTYSSKSKQTNAQKEFLAVKGFEALGFHIIKPQFSINDAGINVIVYDFTNKQTIYNAYHKKIITAEEYLKCEEYLEKLEEESQNPKSYLYKFKDFMHQENVFVEKLDSGAIKLSFTDLFF